MKRLIVSMGNFGSNNSIKNLKIANSLDVNGVELSLAFFKKFDKFKINKNNKSLINNFEIKGIHAPVDVDSSKKEILDKLKKIYDNIDANYIVTHAHRIKNFNYLNKQNGYNILLENSRKKFMFDINKIKKLKKYKNLNFVLDITHSMEYSLEYPEKIYKILKDRIKLIHLSIYNKTRHMPLYSAPKKILKKIEFIKEMNVPLVIELCSPKLDVLKKEIKFVKENYCG